MARVAEEELERIKREVSIERLVEASGIELRRHGADLIGLCPFHDDSEPSLVLTPAKNLWHCLGACQTGGSVIDWVMKAQGVSFRHAVELLRNGHSPLAAVPARPVKQSTTPKLPSPFEREVEDEELARRVVDFYHATLKANSEALGYLAKRGLESPEMIERFRLGYSNRTLGYRLPAKNRQAGEEIRSRLEKLGFLRPSGHELFSGSLVVPIFDEAGRVAEVYGRKIHENLRAGTPKHLYLPGPHRGVWNSEALVASDEIILCEALIDALTFWAAGFRNVTTSYGVECLATQRAGFAKAAAGELHVEEETVRRDLKKVLGKLEELQDEQIRQALEPKAATAVKLTDHETEEALAFLKDPRLVERILEDFERCGVVGEETNKLVSYLAAVSRKLAKPLAIMIQSSSAAGKSWLMDSVLEFIPEEERVKYTALTGQSLFYMSETNLQHKVLAIAEEEGAQRASYALKTLQSDGRVSIASVGKEPDDR